MAPLLAALYHVAIAATSWSRGRLDIFGLGTTNGVFHKAWNGSSWLPSTTGYESLGGVFNTHPVVASWASNRLDVFGTGTVSIWKLGTTESSK
jgi:hypothetical protein